MDAVDTRIENISIQGEAVRATIVIRRDGSTEAIQIDLLVSVVELEDIADTLNGVQVLVSVWIHVVERFRRARISVREGKVDGDGKVDRTTAKNILEERMLAFNLQVL